MSLNFQMSCAQEKRIQQMQGRNQDMRDRTFVLEVQDDGSVDGGHGEVGEGAVLQLQVQSDRAQVRLPAQRPHGLKQETNCCSYVYLYFCLPNVWINTVVLI